jgi:hypothetical protein
MTSDPTPDDPHPIADVRTGRAPVRTRRPG